MFYMDVYEGGALSAKSSCLFRLIYHDSRSQKIVKLCMFIDNSVKMLGNAIQ